MKAASKAASVFSSEHFVLFRMAACINSHIGLRRAVLKIRWWASLSLCPLSQLHNGRPMPYTTT